MRDRTGHPQEQVAIDGMRSVKMQDTCQSTHRIARQNSVASTPATR
jgi:hypothetical protein